MSRPDFHRAIADAPTHALVRRPWRRRALLAALALSLAAHLAVSLLQTPAPPTPGDTPLTATITEMPPPPAPVVQPAAPANVQPSTKARPKRKPPPPAPPPSAPAVVTAPASDSDVPAPTADAGRDTPASSVAAPVVDAPPANGNASPAVADAVNAKTLPPRIDLAYKVFVGTRGLQVGEATYRFEHANQRYRISTVGQGIGLAALLLRGQAGMESVGLITPQGLQPLEFRVERFNNRGREEARFDWESGVLRLDGDRVVSLDVPTFDPLVLMWQYYFTPPAEEVLAFSVATTRRVTRVTATREGRERVQWGNGPIEAERWVRVSEDGRVEMQAWLAPDLRYLPVKMRVTSTARGTLEAVLDAIRVDETGETVGRDDIVLRASPPALSQDPASPASMPGWSPPGATFPSMTP